MLGDDGSHRRNESNESRTNCELKETAVNARTPALSINRTGSGLPYFAVAQTAGKPEEDAKPNHTLVPLTTWNPGGVVSGDPNKPGAAFVIRIAHQANQVIVPHWHPEDEHIVVVMGTWYLGERRRL